MRLALVASLLLVPAASGAGELSTMHGLAVRDATHMVTVRLDGRVARFRISHTLVSRDRRGDEALLEVDLPDEGAAVGLRARAGGRWIGGRLLESEKAGARYEELTQSGRPDAGRGAALLEWVDVGRVSLAMFPVSRRAAAGAEIEAVAPVCYAEGLAVAHYPLPTQDSRVARPALQVLGGPRHWIVRPGRPVPAAIAERWPRVVERCEDAGSDDLAIVFDREPRAPVTAATATLDLATARRVAWVEVEAARQLAPVPRGARVLFVVDASRSLEAADVAAELALVKGYLANLADAEFEVIVYRRRATRLFGRFQPARRAERALAALPAGALEQGNGSHLDAGLALAGSLARGARGPVRVIAFSDDLVRGALDARAMATALGHLPAGAVAHLVELSGAGGDFEWQRLDDHDFARPVMASGGMVVDMSGDQAASAREAMRGLVQPLRVDGFRIDGAELGDLSGELDDDGALPAGRGIRLSALVDRAVGPLTARGRIWGRELVLPIPVDRGLAAALPAFVFGSERQNDLDDVEKKDAALRGGVVSPVTSLLVELDDRPTAHDELLGTSGCGCDGPMIHGSRSGVARMSGVGRVNQRPEPDRLALLSGALDARLRACAALHGAAPIELTIETTVDEVVDVAATGGSAALADCAREAAWALALDPHFFDQRHASFRLPFAGK